MPRTLHADSQIPSSKSQIPYPEHETIVNGILKHMSECAAGIITGAGGAGGTLDLPFDPGYVFVVNGAGTPRVRHLFVGTGVQRDEAGAAATGVSIANDDNGKPRRVTLDVATAANGEVVQVIAWGFRDVSGVE